MEFVKVISVAYAFEFVLVIGRVLRLVNIFGLILGFLIDAVQLRTKLFHDLPILLIRSRLLVK